MCSNNIVEFLLAGVENSPTKLTQFKETLTRTMIRKNRDICYREEDAWRGDLRETTRIVMQAGEFWLSKQTSAARMVIAGHSRHQLARKVITCTEDLVRFVAFRTVQRNLVLTPENLIEFDKETILEIWDFRFDAERAAGWFTLDVRGWLHMLPTILDYTYRARTMPSPFNEIRII